MIDDAIYYLAGADANVSDTYAYNYYIKERSDNTWNGKVGLIYGSDYMYSADLNLCKDKREGYVSNSNCNSGWLYKMHDNVMSDLESSDATVSRDIYPVVYLKSDIIIDKGIGSKDNPYIIG